MFLQEKLTESNFTLGALSPESAELVGQLDPVLGSISAPNLTATGRIVGAGATFESLLSTRDLSPSLEDQLLNSTELDLGFYLPSDDDNNNNNNDEPAKEEEASIDILSEQLEASLEDMIQTAQMHPRSLQVTQTFHILLLLRSFVLSISLARSLGRCVFSMPRIEDATESGMWTLNTTQGLFVDTLLFVGTHFFVCACLRRESERGWCFLLSY